MNCKQYDNVALIMHTILHDSEYCLMWSNISCIRMLQDFIMVQIMLPDLNVSSIIAFVDVLEYVFYTLDGSANFQIHVAIELHKQLRVMWNNP